MAPTIRPAVLADIPALLGLWLAADAEPTHTDDVESVSALMSHDPGAVMVAELEGEVVGSVIAAWDGWRGSVYRLAVAPRLRRQGLGGRLLRAAEVRLAGLGVIRSQAVVVATDSQALAFWRRSGWEQQTERLRFVWG